MKKKYQHPRTDVVRVDSVKLLNVSGSGGMNAPEFQYRDYEE